MVRQSMLSSRYQICLVGLNSQSRFLFDGAGGFKAKKVKPAEIKVTRNQDCSYGLQQKSMVHNGALWFTGRFQNSFNFEQKRYKHYCDFNFDFNSPEHFQTVLPLNKNGMKIILTSNLTSTSPEYFKQFQS